MMQGHHPKVRRRPDERWEVRCSECEKAKVTQRPVGIGLPVGSKTAATMMRDNHALKRAAS